jgi:hypothetical protein
MLITRYGSSAGSGEYLSAFAFAREVWLNLVDVRGFGMDTRYIPGVGDPPKPRVCLVLITQGWLSIEGVRSERFSAPDAVLFSEEQYEGASGKRSLRVRSSRDRFVGIEVHLPEASLARAIDLPARMALEVETWEAATRAAVLSDDDIVIARNLHTLLARLSADGIMREQAVAAAMKPPPLPIQLLWPALAPRIQHAIWSTRLGDLARDLGLKTVRVEREMQRLLAVFGLPGPGLRSVAHQARMTMAAVFLSGKGVSVAEAASLSGYGSTIAMARAFRDAGLPAPSVVQRDLLDSWEE